MQSPRRRIPSYRRHKPSGRAVVTLDGTDHYLGAWNTAESRAVYDRLVAEWLAGGSVAAQARAGRTVNEILLAYWSFAQGYYVKNGRPTSQQQRIQGALKRVRDLYGPTPAAKFGPLALKAIRETMVLDGWCRRYVNQCVSCIKLCFQWAVSEELCPPSVSEGLRTVAGLRAGRTTAPESPPVKPVPEADFWPAVAALPAPLRAVAELQYHTGMRSGEVLQMRPADVDRSGAVWVYRPPSHKTQHRGADRLVMLGPAAQAVLAPWLERAADKNCFRPAESAADQAAGHADRKDERAPGEQYHPVTYAHAVKRACLRAGVGHWHPHQLRHNAATRLVDRFGWDVARILLGHKDIAATKIYAEDSMNKARDAASVAC